VWVAQTTSWPATAQVRLLLLESAVRHDVLSEVLADRKAAVLVAALLNDPVSMEPAAMRGLWAILHICRIARAA
jgi:hypothetical protein